MPKTYSKKQKKASRKLMAERKFKGPILHSLKNSQRAIKMNSVRTRQKV